jgi:putative DNA primase/helicase
MSKGITERILTTILPTNHFAIDASQILHVYENGVYKPNGDSSIQKLIPPLLQSWDIAWASSIPSEVIKYLIQTSPQLPEKPRSNTVNLQNGVLDLTTRKLLPHSPADLDFIQLPIKYDPHATCPTWERCINDWFPADSQTLAWELIAWIIQPHVQIQKAIILFGSGSNGKSLFLNGLTTFLGLANVANKSLFDLETNRFSAAFLASKIVNICADLPAGKMTDTGIFKAIVGGDSITGEVKFKPAFNLHLFTKLIFSTNYLPRSTDTSDAFFRRWMVIPFDKVFADNPKQKKLLEASLYSEAEMSGLLNKALQYTQHVADFGLSESTSTAIAHSEYKEDADTISTWLNLNIIERSTTYLIKPQLYQAYERDYPDGTSATAFAQRLQDIYPEVESSIKRIGAKTFRCWEGVTWKGSI